MYQKKKLMFKNKIFEEQSITDKELSKTIFSYARNFTWKEFPKDGLGISYRQIFLHMQITPVAFLTIFQYTLFLRKEKYTCFLISNYDCIMFCGILDS